MSIIKKMYYTIILDLLKNMISQRYDEYFENSLS